MPITDQGTINAKIIDDIDDFITFHYDIPTNGLGMDFFDEAIPNRSVLGNRNRDLIQNSYEVTYQHIVGVVLEDGNRVSNKLVRVYHRASGNLIGEYTTDVNGEYEITNIPKDAQYFIMAFDNDGTPLKNAAIKDVVTGKDV